MEIDIKQIKELLLTSPETGNECVICSDVTHYKDGTYSFKVMDIVTKEKWMHVIQTAETA
jgi:hypothetical protein